MICHQWMALSIVSDFLYLFLSSVLYSYLFLVRMIEMGFRNAKCFIFFRLWPKGKPFQLEHYQVQNTKQNGLVSMWKVKTLIPLDFWFIHISPYLPEKKIIFTNIFYCVGIGLCLYLFNYSACTEKDLLLFSFKANCLGFSSFIRIVSFFVCITLFGNDEFICFDILLNTVLLSYRLSSGRFLCTFVSEIIRISNFHRKWFQSIGFNQTNSQSDQLID